MNMLQMHFIKKKREPLCSLTERPLRSAHAIAGGVFSLVFTYIFTLPPGFPGQSHTLHYGECCCRGRLGALLWALQSAGPRNGEGQWSERVCLF